LAIDIIVYDKSIKNAVGIIGIMVGSLYVQKYVLLKAARGHIALVK